MSQTELDKKIGYQGKIIRVVETTMPDGRIFETAVRSPGTRIIIHDVPGDRVLLSREYRQEINGYDYRLPGGKVRDKITDWDEIKDRSDLLSLIAEASKKEAREEVGVEVENIEFFAESTSGGSTIEWSLYYFATTNFKLLDQQDLGAGEDIATTWVSVSEAIDICLSGKMKEGRSASVLLQYLHTIGKI